MTTVINATAINEAIANLEGQVISNISTLSGEYDAVPYLGIRSNLYDILGMTIRLRKNVAEIASMENRYTKPESGNLTDTDINELFD